MASVMAATISRFCSSVRPAYHCTVMLGMSPSCRGEAGHLSRAMSSESGHVIGKVGRERVRLHGAVGVEAHRQVLADLGARLALAVEPPPRLVAAVEAHLVRLAEDALERRLVRLAHHDELPVGRGELAAELDGDAARGEREGEQGKDGGGPTHARDYHTRASEGSMSRARAEARRSSPARRMRLAHRRADRRVSMAAVET